MTKQSFDIDGYWKVVVYYDLDPAFFDDVEFELLKTGFSRRAIDEIYDTMKNREAKAVTCSIGKAHTSVVIFNPHSSEADYLSSIVHEAEHVKQAVLAAYSVEDEGEAPAYTIGYIVKMMYSGIRSILYRV